MCVLSTKSFSIYVLTSFPVAIYEGFFIGIESLLSVLRLNSWLSSSFFLWLHIGVFLQKKIEESTGGGGCIFHAHFFIFCVDAMFAYFFFTFVSFLTGSNLLLFVKLIGLCFFSF